MQKINIILALLLVVLISCEKNEHGAVLEDSFSNNTIENALLIRNHRKLDNPYSVANMKLAYLSLQQDGSLKSAISIEPTHLYVRFLPANGDEFEILKGDSTLTLFSYPLDCELSEGEIYVDSTLTGSFTWLYTKVPVGFVSPINGYEIIDELFLPNDIQSSTKGLKSQPFDKQHKEFWDMLEKRSLMLTGNDDESTSSNEMLKSSWIPNATIKVKDDVNGSFIPLQGVIVRARWWFNWEEGTTNSNGYAKMSGSFRGKVNWSIVWEGRDWDIREGNYGQAYYNGPNGSVSNWIMDIDKGGLSFVYAHVHRSCFAYWHNSIDLKTPFNDSFWSQRVKIGVHDEADRAFMAWGLRYVLGAMVNIYRYTSSGADKNCASIMLTATHELAHVSHWDMNSSDYTYGDDIVVESWAVGVAYFLTTQFYTLDDRQSHTFSYIIAYKESKYTPLVIDLVDNYDQRAENSGSILYPTDSVSGYTISQIESSLMGARTLQQWRDNLKNEHSNPTEVYIDELFDNYINMQ